MRSPSQHKQPPYHSAQLSPVASRRNMLPQQNIAPSPRGGKPPVSPPVSPLPSPKPGTTDTSAEPSAHNAARRFSSCPVRSEAQRLPQSPASNASASAPPATAISSFPLVGMWAKQTRKPAGGAEGGSGISAPAPAGGSGRREDRARNELLRPSAIGDARSGSRSGRSIGATSGRCSPPDGDFHAISEEVTDGKHQDAANGAVTDGASDGASDGGDSDEEFVDLYWTALEHRKAANAAVSTALNRLGVGAGGAKAEASSGGGSARHGERNNGAERFGGRRRRRSSFGDLAEANHPLQGGEVDGSGRFARRQVGQVGCREGGSGGDIATGSGRLGEKESAAAAAVADFAFPKYGAASNGVARSRDEDALPGHRRRHSITCIDTELKEFLDLVDLDDEEDAEEAAEEVTEEDAEEGEKGEAEGEAEHEGGMRRNGRNLVRRDTRGRPGVTATVRSPAVAAASPTASNPASMRTSNPSPRTRSGPLLANTHAATSASPFARLPARRRSQTCIDADLKEFLDLIDSDEGEEGDEGVGRERGEGGEVGETGKGGEGGEEEGRRVSFEFVTPEAGASARRSAAIAAGTAGGAAAVSAASPGKAAAAELLFNPWRPAALAPPASASASAAPASAAAASAAASAAGSAAGSALTVPPAFAGSQGHRRRHSITCIDTELKEFLDLVDQEDDVDEYISTRVVHLPAPLPTVTDPLVPAPYSARAAVAEERTGSGKTPSGSGSSSSSSVFSTALTPLAPDDLPLGYSASSPAPLSPASLFSPSASPLSSPSAPAAVAGFPRHSPAALTPNGGASTPKSGAMAAQVAAAAGARRGGCAGGDSSRVGVSRSGGVASLWAAASHNPAIAQSSRRPAAAAVPGAVYTGGAPAAAAPAAADRATARPANSLRVNGRRLSAGDLSAPLGGSSFEISDSDYKSGYPTGYATKDMGVTMAVDVTSSGGGSSNERSMQMCLNEARPIAGVCYPSLAAGSPAPGPSGPSSPPGRLGPLGSLGPPAPPRPASIGKLLGGDITRASESARAAPRVGQDFLGNALPGSACELFPARARLLRPGTPGVPSLGGAGGAADGVLSTPIAAASSLAASAGKGSQARAHHRRSSSAVVVPQLLPSIRNLLE
ncbi:unnamed protein product [Closterium sp. Naga37s-1]|nr:unnamed protein product [Closterium sp. Naga37s-1]